MRAPSPPAAPRTSMGAMELLEIEQRETLPREEVARRLHAFEAL